MSLYTGSLREHFKLNNRIRIKVVHMQRSHRMHPWQQTLSEDHLHMKLESSLAGVLCTALMFLWMRSPREELVLRDWTLRGL